MKIFAIGMNYEAHNKELQHTLLLNDPVVFMKADPILKNGKPFFIPDFSSEIHYETELVIKISRLGKNIAEQFAYRYFEEVTVGIDFTARDMQKKLRDKGLPWELSKAFDNSAAVGDFVPKSDFGEIQQLSFHLDINEKTVQKGCTNDMLYSVHSLISYISQFFTLRIGDLIFTGTPAGVGPVKIGDHLQGYLENIKLLDFYIR